ncbi:MAG: uroporphyrinogen-III C-methyltransferase [Alphaproteobacteria bacterium]|nr:uroporphyrinogen-III C-methyltransferase [Alphaproteobacteria bacterium]
MIARHPTRTRNSEERIAPLAELPVFFTLTGKPVLVVGGSEAAAWKAHLLAAAGARVTVVAPELDAAFDDLFPQGSFDRKGLHWRPGDLVGMHLAVADIEGEDEALRFASSARAAGVPFNVIDRPEFCAFQFGAIVNRSPVVVGISTAGAAPILGQAVRRRIETLLPDFLAAWAGIAARLRGTVMARLSPGAERRAFWERFAEAAFRAPPDGDAVESWIGDAVSACSGHVTLVGAGPGDAEHLTIKAVRALQSADFILFDDFISAEVLELARREAKRILVGERGGREDINDLMLRLARQGRHVVRLKSGDPMIFGRGGEEIEKLRSEGIAVSVVPGIATAPAPAVGRDAGRTDATRSIRVLSIAKSAVS